ncbi:MAG: hypothetical protein IPK24_14505 [Kineosporiaceae bacterium]|nr:hypothetical protein [Kineosporiaceae bacterium]
MSRQSVARDLESLAQLGVAARAPIFALATVTLGAGGHVVSGGGLPGPLALAASTATVGLVAWRTARREHSLPRLLVAVGASQVALHLAFGLGASADGHRHAGSPGLPAAWMWAAHLLAALSMAWWLRRGEAAVWRLVRRAVQLAVRLVRHRLGLPLAPRLQRTTPAWHGLMAGAQHLVIRCAPHRGPPVLI